MSILKHAIKEFWLPVIAAIVWAIYNYGQSPANERTISSFINIFGATFFFVSWLTSQYFRIRKQKKVDEGMARIETASIEILEHFRKEASERILQMQRVFFKMLEQLGFNAVKDRLGISAFRELAPDSVDQPGDLDIPRIVRFWIQSKRIEPGCSFSIVFRVVDNKENFAGNLTVLDTASKESYSSVAHEYGFYSCTVCLSPKAEIGQHQFSFKLADQANNSHVQSIFVDVQPKEQVVAKA